MPLSEMWEDFPASWRKRNGSEIHLKKKKIHTTCFFEARKVFSKLEENCDQENQVKDNTTFSSENLQGF